MKINVGYGEKEFTDLPCDFCDKLAIKRKTDIIKSPWNPEKERLGNERFVCEDHLDK